MSDNFFYITTTLPYVNSDPHIGFGLEITEADVVARYQRMLGKKVFFNTGTDEHGQKILKKSQENKIGPQTYADRQVISFEKLKNILNLSYNNFVRTTDEDHIKSAQEFWKIVFENDDIYKANYEIKYCVGCELEKTESELVDGNYCPLHPDQKLEIRKEENYFFKFSKYQQALLDFYEKNPEFVKPAGKMKEIKSFVKQGLKDFSISRLKSKMPWGIEVPNDPDHVMYVWFDALVNYISALDWPQEKNQFERYWPGIQLAGKDNLRQQAAMWQAMLMSAGLPNSRRILINGFISVEGEKMSKSQGNVIRPDEMKVRYGTDATRYLLISLGTFTNDMDVSWDKFDERYTADLSNAIGNLCSRVAKMAADEKLKLELPDPKWSQKYQDFMEEYQLSAALDWILEQVKETDQYLSETKPWKLSGEDKVSILRAAVERIRTIGLHLQPFMPETGSQILSHFDGNIKALDPLFPRLDQ